jgi:thiol-disulfide isomerase/thioredoxin
MKFKLFSALGLASALFLQSAPAQDSTAPTNPELAGLVQQVNDKIKDGHTSEAEFTGELQKFDTLIAAHQKDTQPNAEAELIYMKAMLYIQVFNDPEKSREMMKTLATDYGTTKFGQSATKILAQLSQMDDSKKAQDSLAVGSTFPDFSEQDLNGKPLSVGSLKGKVVLVDFWATWCGPCRAELPHVIATYEKHHKDGFEIIGVSLDSERDKVDAFLKQQSGMAWPQFYDGQGWSNKLAVKYGVEAIPFAVLIGPDGKIIGKDLRGDDLENAVADALAKK